MPRYLPAVALALSSALPSPATAGADLRDPNGAGRYSGPPLLTTWGPATNVAWKAKPPGLGWSSPIVVKGKLFLTPAVPLSADDQPDYSLRALCLDPATG